MAGVSHLIDPDKATARINAAAFKDFALFFGDPYWLGVFTGFTLLLSGVAFLFGVFIRWSAAVLFFVLIPITITIQMGNGVMHGPLWKNIALFGGLMFFIINNPKSYCLYNK